MEQKKRLESSDATTVAMSAREDEHGHVIMGSDVQFDLSDLCASQPSSSGAGGPLKRYSIFWRVVGFLFYDVALCSP